ncbi:MAG: SDR family oxidoreductase [Bacteroidales bacterium]|nr:SDR family oxidoreductase [Bacteroidales bacterium]
MLQGKRVLVTGSSQGIGLAAGRAMAAAGARVVFTSERPAHAVPDVEAVRAQYPGCVYQQSDLTRDGEADRLMAAAVAALGGVDVLVNNLGTFREPEFLSLTRKDFDFLFGLNVWSAIAMTQAFVRQSQNAAEAASGKSGGRVLFTTSLNGSRSEPAHTLYDASKGAINALTRQLAIELAPLGITTAAVAPGLVATPLTDFGLQSDPVARQAVVDQIPIRKIASVEDVAGWFVFLASEAAHYATGIVVPVDGGLDAQQMPSRPITEAEKGT